MVFGFHFTMLNHFYFPYFIFQFLENSIANATLHRAVLALVYCHALGHTPPLHSTCSTPGNAQEVVEEDNVKVKKAVQEAN